MAWSTKVFPFFFSFFFFLFFFLSLLSSLLFWNYSTLFYLAAMHKRTGQIVAIKQVLVKEDTDEIMKEIAYMKGCQSDYIVRFYGHYLKGDTLWVDKLSFFPFFLVLTLLFC